MFGQGSTVHDSSNGIPFTPSRDVLVTEATAAAAVLADPATVVLAATAVVEGLAAVLLWVLLFPASLQLLAPDAFLP